MVSSAPFISRYFVSFKGHAMTLPRTALHQFRYADQAAGGIPPAQQVRMSEPNHLDTLAAEYVLGTLDSDERTQAQTLLSRDQEFAAKVQLWKKRLGELN